MPLLHIYIYIYIYISPYLLPWKRLRPMTTRPVAQGGTTPLENIRRPPRNSGDRFFHPFTSAFMSFDPPIENELSPSPPSASLATGLMTTPQNHKWPAYSRQITAVLTHLCHLHSGGGTLDIANLGTHLPVHNIVNTQPKWHACSPIYIQLSYCHFHFQHCEIYLALSMFPSEV